MEPHEPSVLELFGQLLKRDREELSLTQAELARRVGCRLHDVVEVEEGRTMPSKGMALRLQEVFQRQDDSFYKFVSCRENRTRKTVGARRHLDERTRKILRDISGGSGR